MKIINVASARPNFMKVAPLLEEYKNHQEIDARLLHTGQHYDYEMSKIFFDELGIPKPDFHLGVGSGTHAEQTAKVMTEFENALYAENLSKDEFNKKWWELAKTYQGMVPPSDRGEEFCDAASKTHINNDAAQYYDYAVSYILLFQFHDHIAKNILEQDPHATNYFGSKAVGTFLRGVLETGANNDWRALLKESVGSEMSAKPMLDYFAPLMDYLKTENQGRTYTLPESF